MDFSNLLINCNRLGKIFARNTECITDKELQRIEALQSKEIAGTLKEKELDRLEFLIGKRDESDPHIISKAAMAYLLYIYMIKKYGKPVELLSTDGYMPPAAKNGILKENYSIDLIERLYGKKLYRNKQTLKNERLMGIIDAWDTQNWENSDCVHEIKTTSNSVKFQMWKRYPLSKPILLQVQGYMAITGKDVAEVNFCLVDHPESVISDERDCLKKYLCGDGEEDSRFAEEWAIREDRLRFKYMPDRHRIFTCIVHRDDEAIEKIYEKVDNCRKWLTDFEAFDEEILQGRYVNANKIRL
jgi:hypothetical protein